MQGRGWGEGSKAWNCWKACIHDTLAPVMSETCELRLALLLTHVRERTEKGQ